MLIAGVAWTVIASGFNVAVQSATPAWIRGRVLSIYLVVFQGATAIGSILWGAVAARTDVRHALLIAAIALVGGLLLRLRYPLRVSDEDLSHDPYWTDPIVREAPVPRDGPVLVLVEYRVRAAEHDEFVTAMTSLGQERRRSGAFVWELFRDLATPGRFVETFLVESWLDHLRQHDRVTVAGARWERRIEATLEEGWPSTTTHFVSVRGSKGG
jgi:MFS family permease